MEGFHLQLGTIAEFGELSPHFEKLLGEEAKRVEELHKVVEHIIL